MNAGKTFFAIAFVVGVLMMLQGVVGVFAYTKIKRTSRHMGYFPVEALLSIILSIIVLSNQLIVDVMVPVFFGMWLLFTGATRIVSAVELGKDTENMWVWKLGLGLLALIAGIYAFFNPILVDFSVAIIVGISFMVQGMNLLFSGIEMPQKRKRSRGMRERISEISLKEKEEE